jgi:hypothetical protein
LPDDGWRAAKDAGEQARPRARRQYPQLATTAAGYIQLPPLPPWITRPTTTHTRAAPAHGHRRRNTIARRSASLPAATSPHLRCLRPRHRTARTRSNMDTWGTAPSETAPTLPRQRTANRTPRNNISSNSSSSSSSSPARMRRSCRNTRMLSTKPPSRASSPKDTTAHGRSASSSTTSSRPRSQDLSAMARRTLSYGSTYMYVQAAPHCHGLC